MVSWKHSKELVSDDMIDYKFYCFNGTPKFLYISEGLKNHATAKISFAMLDWKKTPFYRMDYEQFDVLPPKPDNFKEMLDLAIKLSEGIRFVRVDLYSINNEVRFSELTFSPNSGLMFFNDERYDYEVGNMLHL